MHRILIEIYTDEQTDAHATAEAAASHLISLPSVIDARVMDVHEQPAA